MGGSSGASVAIALPRYIKQSINGLIVNLGSVPNIGRYVRNDDLKPQSFPELDEEINSYNKEVYRGEKDYGF